MIKLAHQVLSIRQCKTNHLLQDELKSLPEEARTRKQRSRQPAPLQLPKSTSALPLMLPFQAEILIANQLAVMECLVIVNGRDWMIKTLLSEDYRANWQEWQQQCYRSLERSLVEKTSAKFSLGIRFEQLQLLEVDES